MLQCVPALGKMCVAYIHASRSMLKMFLLPGPLLPLARVALSCFFLWVGVSCGWVAAARSRRQTLDQRRLKYAFERLDHDNNGELDYEVWYDIRAGMMSRSLVVLDTERSCIHSSISEKVTVTISKVDTRTS